MSFQNGLSGLSAASKNLDVIGNNVANVNTVGAKAGRAQFADVYANSLYGQGSSYNGIGVTVASVDQQFTQGDLTSSNNPLDMAINGSGFFRLSNNGALAYSRNGEFRLDKDSYITSSEGGRLTGYAADATGGIRVGVPTELKLNMADIAPKATDAASIALNLDSRNAIIDPAVTPFSMTDTKSYTGATSLSAYDQQGDAHVLSTYYQKTGDNTWAMYGASDGVAIAGPGANGQLADLTFNADGSLASPTTAIAVTIPTPASVGGTQTLQVDMTKLTQYGSTFSVNTLTQNGFAPGQVSGFTIANDGTILANYTNGQTKAQGQVVLANFSNPQGLTPKGGNQWEETAVSGQPVVGTPASGALGNLKSGALEGSNVDLTAELVNMITAQRSYQANAQTIKTQDQVLQTIVNLR